jgi:hypothetical protein
LVFLTPYVLDTPESMAAEARRRKDYLDVKGMWTKGWSDSKLADETMRQKLKREKAEHATERAREAQANEQAEDETAEAPRVNVLAASVTTNVFIGSTNTVPATTRDTK